MNRKTALILLSVLLAVIILIFILSVIDYGGVESRALTRLVISMGLCISAFIKVLRKPVGAGPEAYAKEYAGILRTAFSGPRQKSQRKKLLDAIALYNKDRMVDALKKLSRLLPQCQSTDEHCAVLMFMALCYTDLELPEQAITVYDKLLSMDNGRSTAWSNLGLLYKKQGNNLQSLVCYENAVRHDPENPYAYNNMALAYYSLGEYEKAIEPAKKALELKNNLYQASNTLCLAYQCLGNSEEASRYYQLSVANGADAQKLRKAIENCRVSMLTPQGSENHTPQIARALDEFSRQTGRSFVQAGIPYSNNRSRFGGPALGTAPLDSQGRPMRLLCALYCSEIKNVPDFPASGLLQFYIADNSFYGLDPHDQTTQKDWRILYTETEDLPECPDPIAPSKTFPILGRWPIEFYPDVCMLTATDFRFQDTMDACLAAQGAPTLQALSEDSREDIYDRFNGDGHRVGGYPHFNQYDPRMKPQLQKYDTLLLQITTHYSEQGDFIRIGDNGIINFFISRENLMKKDFSDVLYNWDCE